jgi:hypothetical protein
MGQGKQGNPEKMGGMFGAFRATRTQVAEKCGIRSSGALGATGRLDTIGNKRHADGKKWQDLHSRVARGAARQNSVV